LNAGTVTAQADEYVLTPPETTLFDQLWEWLAAHPRKYYGLRNYMLGIGATALCFRWGTYLACLMDENKPLDPRTADSSTSMIADEEMKRINIEASYNLARLFEKMHQDEPQALDYILRAYDWLPMPSKSVKPKREGTRIIYAVLANYTQFLEPALREYSERAGQHPYRSLANMVTALAYRNGEVENVHAGKQNAFSLTHRRFSPRQTRDVLRSIAAHLSVMLAIKLVWDATIPGMSEPWPQRLAGLPYLTSYPRDWSLNQSSALVTLLKKWCE
jgi:hypothetical protein